MRHKLMRPYGDSPDDGKVQLSFTLPLPAGGQAREAAKNLASQMGLVDVQVVHMQDLHQFTYFILYGTSSQRVDLGDLPAGGEQVKALSFQEINSLIAEKIGRKLVVVGACTGTDAHTVGLDAIMDMKGIQGEFGLERYPMLETYNLGSQVANGALLRQAKKVKADAILVSQVVTQKGVHIQNLTELIEMAEADDLRRHVLMIVGGPRIDQRLAAELGFDAGFGVGTTGRDVAQFIAQALAKRL